MNEVVAAVAFVDVLADLLGEQLRGLDVGSIVEHSMFRRFAVGGGGAFTLVMLGRYLRRTQVIFRALSSLGLLLMMMGGLSLLGVVDVNVAKVARVFRGVLGA